MKNRVWVQEKKNNFYSSRTTTFTKNMEETTIPNCEDPDKVDCIGRGATSLSMEISGEGVLAAESEETWWEALRNTEPKQ